MKNTTATFLGTTSTNIKNVVPCATKYQFFEGRLFIDCPYGKIRTSDVRNTIRHDAFMVVSTRKSDDVPLSHWILVDHGEWSSVKISYSSFEWEKNSNSFIYVDDEIMIKNLHNVFSLGKCIGAEYYEVSNYLTLNCEKGKITFAL